MLCDVVPVKDVVSLLSEGEDNTPRHDRCGLPKKTSLLKEIFFFLKKKTKQIKRAFHAIQEDTKELQ